MRGGCYNLLLSSKGAVSLCRQLLVVAVVQQGGCQELLVVAAVQQAAVVVATQLWFARRPIQSLLLESW
jgi:hypothetical protein